MITSLSFSPDSEKIATMDYHGVFLVSEVKSDICVYSNYLQPYALGNFFSDVSSNARRLVSSL